jgi:hypothetical protein
MMSVTLLYEHLQFLIPEDPNLLGTAPEDNDLYINITSWYPDRPGAAKIWRPAYHMEPLEHYVESPD